MICRHHSYNRDNDIDCYESEFIDDTALYTPRVKLEGRRKKGQRKGRTLELTDSDEEERETWHGKRRLGDSSSDEAEETPAGEVCVKEEDNGELVKPVSMQRKRRKQTFDSSSDDTSDSESRPPSTRKRRCKQLESDEETPTRPRSSRVHKLQEKKERDLRANRARMKGRPCIE